jgi:hypothetical protein
MATSKSEELIHRPLVIGVRPVLARENTTVSGNQKVGGKS